MTLRLELKKWLEKQPKTYQPPKQAKPKKNRKQQPLPPQKPTEQLSQRDIEDLMGMHRATYRKSGGVIKQRGGR